MPDAPAVYFVRPTAENIQRIVDDCSKQVRCLTYSLPHSLTYSLTYFLTYSLTHSLTHLLTYSLTHTLTHSLTQIRAYITQLAVGLMSSVRVLGALPIMRAASEWWTSGDART